MLLFTTCSKRQFENLLKMNSQLEMKKKRKKEEDRTEATEKDSIRQFSNNDENPDKISMFLF